MNLKRSLRFGILVAILLLPVVVQAQAPTPAPVAGQIAFRKHRGALPNAPPRSCPISITKSSRS